MSEPENTGCIHTLRETIQRAESALIVILTSEVTEGLTLAQQIELVGSQLENARNAATALSKGNYQ